QTGTDCCMSMPMFCLPCAIIGGNPVGDAEMAVTAAAQAGIHTFVVGVATNSMSDTVLNTMAMNGGEPRPNGPPFYYLVTNQQDLVNVIMAIAGQITSCSFMLQMRPPYPDGVHIYANTNEVPRDPTHMNGWDYGPNNMS